MKNLSSLEFLSIKEHLIYLPKKVSLIWIFKILWLLEEAGKVTKYKDFFLFSMEPDESHLNQIYSVGWNLNFQSTFNCLINNERNNFLVQFAPLNRITLGETDSQNQIDTNNWMNKT